MSDDSWIDLDERRPPEHVDRGAPSRGVRTVSAFLPSGRVVWLRIGPPLAPAVVVNHLAQDVEHAARRRRAAAESQSDAVARLSRTVAAGVKQLSEGKLERARGLRRRIVAGDLKVDRKLAKAATEYRARVERQIRIEREAVRRLGRRDLWDWIVIVSALPLFAVFGQRGRPLGEHNVALALSLLIWLVGDEIMDLLFGAEKASPYPLRDADVWSYLAPVGNVLAGWWLLGDRQHQRFIAGREVLPADAFVGAVAGSELVYRCKKPPRVSLSRFVARDHFPDFEAFTDVPAVATVTSIPRAAAGDARIRSLSASVQNGELTIAVEVVAPDLRAPAAPIPALVGALEIAWMVDTQKPATSPVPN